MHVYRYIVFFFFFQAEDGIRDYKVTGVQTCALPVSRAEVIVERAPDVEPCGAVSRDAPGVTNRRGEPALDEAMDQHVIGRAVPRGHGVVQEREQRVAQLELYLVVQPPHHAEPHAL